MNRYKRHAIIVIALFQLVFATLVGIAVVVDPFGLFHKQPFARPRYFQTSANADRQRLHAMGLIYSHVDASDIDDFGILVGSSRTTGMRPSLIARKLNLKHVVNLSLSGSRGPEQHILAERALDTGKVKTVVWEVDYWFIDASKPRGTGAIPDYLLTRSRWDDFRYFITPSVMRDAVNLVTGWDLENWTENLDSINHFIGCQSRRAFEVASLKAAKAAEPISRVTRYGPADWRGPFPRLDQDYISLIRRYPKVKFYLLFPVVPNLSYAASKPAWFPVFLGGRHYLVDQLKNNSNVHIFAFDTDRKVTGNLANFFDPQHFGHGLDDYIFDCIGSGRNELNMSNIADYEKAFTANVDHFSRFYDPSTAMGYVSPWQEHSR